uniref:Uncharacterized protein n=1 Tax=Echinococcus canadensis TaxID=519352 RepID=A0A915ET19_9CEST
LFNNSVQNVESISQERHEYQRRSRPRIKETNRNRTSRNSISKGVILLEKYMYLKQGHNIDRLVLKLNVRRTLVSYCHNFAPKLANKSAMRMNQKCFLNLLVILVPSGCLIYSVCICVLFICSKYLPHLITLALGVMALEGFGLGFGFFCIRITESFYQTLLQKGVRLFLEVTGSNYQFTVEDGHAVKLFEVEPDLTTTDFSLVGACDNDGKWCHLGAINSRLRVAANSDSFDQLRANVIKAKESYRKTNFPAWKVKSSKEERNQDALLPLKRQMITHIQRADTSSSKTGASLIQQSSSSCVVMKHSATVRCVDSLVYLFFCNNYNNLAANKKMVRVGGSNSVATLQQVGGLVYMLSVWLYKLMPISKWFGRMTACCLFLGIYHVIGPLYLYSECQLSFAVF